MTNPGLILLASAAWLSAIPAVALADGELEDLSPEARREYQLHYLSVDDGLVGTSGESRTTLQLHRGKYRAPLGPSEFFRVVGRPDHAEFHDRRVKLKLGLMAAGLAAVTVGTIIQVQAITARSCERQVDDPRF